MNTDGTTIALEGIVPEGLTLLSGDGTSHIEFSYDTNTKINATVSIDSSIDYKVLTVQVMQSMAYHGSGIHIPDDMKAILAYNNIPESIVKDSDMNEVGNNDIFYEWLMGDGSIPFVNHLIWMNDAGEYIMNTCECHTWIPDGDGGKVGTSLVVDPANNEFGHVLWRYVVLEKEGRPIDNPYTITVTTYQPDFETLPENEREIYYSLGYEDFFDIFDEREGNYNPYHYDFGSNLVNEFKRTNSEFLKVNMEDDVEPVATTFKLMNPEGTATIIEGSVPEGLTIVGGDGTGHIEFAYNTDPDISVYLDAGLDYDVISSVKCNDYTIDGSNIWDNVNNYTDSLISFYNIPADKIGFAENMVYEYSDWNESCEINDVNYRVDTAVLDKRILSEYAYNEAGEQVINFFYVQWNRLLGEGKMIPVENPDESEYGYIIIKGLFTKNENGIPENPFTITVKVNQPDVSSLTDEEIVSEYYDINGYYPFMTVRNHLVEDFAKAF